MAKKVKFPPTKEDIPAWFMTYSDVITLLMTFFILLLTFATTEPERFDQVTSTISLATAGKGRTGEPLAKRPETSWVHRVRPPAARIAIRGAEMPPIMNTPVGDSFGEGLKALDPDENNHNEMTSHYFDIELNRIFDREGAITPHAKYVLAALAVQLKDLPFQANFQFSEPQNSSEIIRLQSHLIREEMVQPGQVSSSRIVDSSLAANKVRVLIKRYEPQ